ncbi:CHO2 [Candida oxycetoniae]|uniref:Phosphatidylethanolamine N-methyltransferase n=1 Tax=Candida oxycetoniae TaxID=497107 RepID=A0AAI9SY21_9ASCO|nr:CHO2 [Candida oxycetoniae]KAI3404830.2 CHO2 [Candida oxycetoniae]
MDKTKECSSLDKDGASGTSQNRDSVGPQGITFSGKTFIVPSTHDMVKTLFDPTLHKSNAELIILACLFANLAVFAIPLNRIRIVIFVGLYIFWRLSYNFGIGWLLQQQSLNNKLVSWAQEGKLFDSNNKSVWAQFVQHEVISQRGEDYKIESMPIEFNTWLVFRKFVDLILMSDFVTFCCVVCTCAMENKADFSNHWLVYTRIVIGVCLILFNLWVKVNAHNTIKDYAWYWGDFFFRQINNEELIFDGVFEMVPHPMYSVGYIGYYGFALIAKSYIVLAIAVFGHFLQMIFLHYIENPHIDKIYGPSKNEINLIKLLKLKDLKSFDNMPPLVGLYNFNFMRASDILNLILVFTYGVVIPVLIKNDSSKLYFSLTIATKLIESFGISTLLVLQSYFKYFTKWCLSNDIPVEKSLNNWAIIYNTLINLTYASLFGLNLIYYLQGSADLLFRDLFYLRIFAGTLLIITQIWINASIIDSIGYFGWFYGDFFIPKSQSITTHLTKAGVYRYLNNPEQIFGVCGVMGVFILWPTVENLTCCFLWVVNNFIRINFIEKSHMVRVYGEHEVNQDSGVTKTFKKHLIPEVIQKRISTDETPSRAIRGNQTIADSLDNFIKDLRNSKTKLSQQKLIELSQNLSFANSEYKLTIEGLKYNDEKSAKFAILGSPLKVHWQSPNAAHSPRDWIGLYKIVQTTYSRNKTLLSSAGRWTFCKEANGSFVFEREKLFWDEGVYEFRYHLDGKHDVAYVSEPFELKCEHLEVPLSDDKVDDFATVLKEKLFDKVFKVESINTPISSVATTQSENVFKDYELLSSIISLSTKVQISPKIFFNSDKITILDVAKKLLHINKVLAELSYDLNMKKNE